MHYENPNEQGEVMMNKPKAFIDYRQKSDIQRTRFNLLIVLGIQLIFCIYALIQRSVDLINYSRLHLNPDQRHDGLLIGQMLVAVFWLIYVIVFILVVIKYIRIAILIFAWVDLILLICILIVLILAGVILIAASAAAHSAGFGIAAGVISLIIVGLACILSILIVVFAFRLAKLLRLQEPASSV